MCIIERLLSKKIIVQESFYKLRLRRPDSELGVTTIIILFRATIEHFRSRDYWPYWFTETKKVFA